MTSLLFTAAARTAARAVRGAPGAVRALSSTESSEKLIVFDTSLRDGEQTPGWPSQRLRPRVTADVRPSKNPGSWIRGLKCCCDCRRSDTWARGEVDHRV